MTELSDVFRQQLDARIQNHSPASACPRKTAREAVRQCIGDIRRGRKKELSWDEIAERIQSSAQSAWGISLSLTGQTAKRYYYQFTAKKRRKKRSGSTSGSVSPQKSKTSTPATTPAQALQSSDPAKTPTPVPVPEPVARSPAPKPKPEPPVTPVVDGSSAPAIPAPQQAASTEELHPNRFRDRFKKVTNPKTTTGYENCKTL